MFNNYRNRRRLKAQKEGGSKPARDFHDWASLVTEILGVVGIVATIYITLKSNSENGQEMARAIRNMSRIAGTLEAQQDAIGSQSTATGALAKSSAKQADAAAKSAVSAQAATKIAQQQTTALYRQLSQNFDLFAIQQRPILAVDLTHPRTSEPIAHGGEIRWNYGFKNYGASPAYDVVYYEAISVYGGPFQERRRVGSKLDVPGTSHWSTAVYAFKPGEVGFDPEGYVIVHTAQRALPILRVRFEYSDALGRKYTSSSCNILDENASSYDCTQ